MEGLAIKTFVETGLLDGQTINDTFFYQLLNIAKTKIEAERNWMVLKKQDSSQTENSGDTFLTTKTLPSDFANMIKLFTAKSDGSGQIFYTPIPFDQRYAYQNSSRVFWIDIANKTFGLCGTHNESRTIHLIYRSTSTDISSETSWVFPSRFHGILGFMVAVMFKGGVDYDEINAIQAIQNDKDSKELWQALIDWDDDLRLGEMNNQYDRGTSVDSDGLPIADPSFQEDIGLY